MTRRRVRWQVGACLAVVVVAAAVVAGPALARVRELAGSAGPACRSVHLVVDERRAPAGAFADVREAAERLQAATGVPFVVSQASAPAEAAAHVSVAWNLIGPTDRKHLIGWSVAHAYAKGTGNGSIQLNPADQVPSGFATRKSWGGVLLHELGHVLGLKHTSDPADIMYGTMQSGPLAWGPGDVGQFQTAATRWGCPPPAPAPAGVPSA